MNYPLRPSHSDPLRGLPAQQGSLRRKPSGVSRFFEALEPRVMLSASIAGQVFNDVNANGNKDAGEGNISGVTVFLDTNMNSILDTGEVSTTTDASGNYSFTGLAAGTYTVSEVLVSNAVESKPTTSSYTVVLTANQAATGKDFGDYVGASISGKVFGDLNANGLIDMGETGLNGIQVFYDKNNNNQLDPGEVSAYTDANGNYTLNALPAGTGHLREFLPTGVVGSSPSTAPGAFTLTPGETVTGQNFGNYNPSAITGQVFNDFNANGTKNTDDTGATGVTVFLDLNNDGVFDSGDLSTTTDGNGNFGFTDLAAGNYSLKEVLPANTLLSTPTGGSYTGAVAAGQTYTGENFGNYPANAIIGEVYNDADKNGVKAASETGRAGVTVFFDMNNNGLLDSGEPTATTDAAGNYDLVVATPAHGTVRVVPSAGFVGSAPSGEGYSVNLAAGQTVTGKDFGTYQIAAAGTTSINGHLFLDYNGNGVEDPGDAAAPGITVFLNSNGSMIPPTTTDAHGNYSFTGLAPGDYTVGQVLDPSKVFQTQPAQGDAPVTITAAGQAAYVNLGDQIIGPDITVAPPTVTFGKVASPTVLTPGDTVTLSFVVSNTGDRPAKGKVDLKIYASAGPVLVSGDLLLFQQLNKSLSLAAGKSTTYTVHVKIPPTIPPGSYYFSGIVQDVTPLGPMGETTTSNNFSTSVAASAIALLFGTFTNHTNTKLVWTTSNGAAHVTTTLKGGGVGQFIPNGDGTYELDLANTTATSSLTITTDSKSTAPLTLGDIQSGAGLGSIVAKTTDVEGDLTIPGALTTLTLHSISIGDTFTLGGRLGALTAASIYGLNLDVTGAIGSITALLWNSGTITATSIGSINITGQRASRSQAAIAGDLSASINLTADAAQQMTLGSLTVAGTLNQSTITSAGSIGVVKLGAMVDSNIYAGVMTTNSPELPDDATDFSDANASIGTLTVLGLSPSTASFVRSRIAAAKVGSIKLAEIDTTGPDGSLFGVAGDSIAMLSYTDPANARITLTNLTLPADPQLISYPIDDFDVVIAS